MALLQAKTFVRVKKTPALQAIFLLKNAPLNINLKVMREKENNIHRVVDC